MTREECDNYLISIGGLVNGHFPDREPIISSGFFSIGDGWLQLVKDLIEELVAAGWNKEICQVKSKFAGLRFYCNDLTNEQYAIIRKYENMSYETCEDCGEPGTPNNEGWLTTLCEKHKRK